MVCKYLIKVLSVQLNPDVSLYHISFTALKSDYKGIANPPSLC